MDLGQQMDAQARLRRIVRYLWIIPALAALYAGWTLYERQQQDRQIERQAIEKRRAEDARTVELLGGNRFEILNFYATPPVIRRGETAQICYGVSNAKAVRLEPPVGRVWPSFSRCLDVSPRKNTTYTLTIEDGKGQTKSATVEVQVR